MLPKYKVPLIVFLFLLLVIVFVYAGYQKPDSFSKLPLISLISPNTPMSSQLVTRTLTTDEVKALVKIPGLRQTITELASSNEKVAAKLKKADNVLLYFSDANDETGRTLLVDTRQNIHKLVMGLGGVRDKYEASVSGKITIKKGLVRTSGIFQAWARVPNSKDLYLILADPDPERKIEYLQRVILEKGGCFSAGLDSGLTDLVIQNIQTVTQQADFSELGPFSSWSENDLAKIIKPGDFVVTYNQIYPLKLRKYGAYEITDYGQKAVCLDSVVINRFDGKKQLEKELKRSIPSIPNSPMLNRILTIYGKRVN